MKNPSANMSESLRGQSPAGTRPVVPTVEKQRGETPASRVIPGESGVENPPGTAHERSVKPYAGAVGGHFGGKS